MREYPARRNFGAYEQRNKKKRLARRDGRRIDYENQY
jgi:hypothetical protein